MMYDNKVHISTYTPLLPLLLSLDIEGGYNPLHGAQVNELETFFSLIGSIDLVVVFEGR